MFSQEVQVDQTLRIGSIGILYILKTHSLFGLGLPGRAFFLYGKSKHVNGRFFVLSRSPEANMVGGLYLQDPVNGKVGAAVNGGPIGGPYKWPKING